MLDSIYSNENFKNCRYLFRINGVLFIIIIIYNFSFTEIKTSSDMFSMCFKISKKKEKKKENLKWTIKCIDILLFY